MTEQLSDRLYNLLPSIYRLRDASDGKSALRALLAIIESEYQALEDDIGGLYDDWFIETCAEWVVPYIGDLLGVRVESGMFAQGCALGIGPRRRRCAVRQRTHQNLSIQDRLGTWRHTSPLSLCGPFGDCQDPIRKFAAKCA